MIFISTLSTTNTLRLSLRSCPSKIAVAKLTSTKSTFFRAVPYSRRTMVTYEKHQSQKGLILVYSEPGPKVPKAEYHDWYNNEHIPLRLNVPGILTSSRYKAIDSRTPSWLALYDVASPDVTQSPEYKALGPNGSQREKNIMADLAHINRRVYEHFSSYVPHKMDTSLLPGRFVFAVHMKVTLEGEDVFNRWYDDEHMAQVSEVPGWLRGRRYKLLESISRGVKIQPDKDEKACVDYLTIHELERDGFTGLSAFNTANQTPWCARAMKAVPFWEPRSFERYLVFR